MRGEKTIKFDFDINYPTGNGQYAATREVTLRAPGLSKSDVFYTLKGYVSKAVTGFAKIHAGTKKRTADQAAGDDEENEGYDKEEVDTMYLMGAGLDIDDYQVFSNYLRRVLTNSSKLASLGDSKAPLSDEAWLEIDAAGGMDAVNKVLAGYVDFFLEPLMSKSKSGKNKSTGSDSPARATSHTTSVKISPSRK